MQREFNIFLERNEETKREADQKMVQGKNSRGVRINAGWREERERESNAFFSSLFFSFLFFLFLKRERRRREQGVCINVQKRAKSEAIKKEFMSGKRKWTRFG